MKSTKKILCICITLLVQLSWACDACKLAQPDVTKDFTHGQGPTGNIDWIIVGVVAVITIYTLVFSIKYLAKPGEKAKNHIKYSILQD